jgi:hypothetical protein
MRETYHGGTETRRRDGVNLRRFLRRNHAQMSAMVLLEWDRRIAELEMTQSLLFPRTHRSRKCEIANLGFARTSPPSLRASVVSLGLRVRIQGNEQQ